MTSNIKKSCKTCKIKQPVENFYINRVNTRRTECKFCYNSKRIKTPRGFKKLTTVDIADIKLRLANGSKKSDIVKLYNLNYPTFHGWVKKGKFN